MQADDIAYYNLNTQMMLNAILNEKLQKKKNKHG